MLISNKKSTPFCTLTGADEHINPDDLWSLSMRFPFVEWGILYSNNRQGDGRYPSFEWINALVKKNGAPAVRGKLPNFALHICGGAVHEFIADPHGSAVGKVVSGGGFQRVQLNFNIQRKSIDMVNLRRALDLCRAKTIITQHNDNNQGVWRCLGGMRNHAVLFDASGGSGRECAHWPEPLVKSNPGLGEEEYPVCGYAGGLGPDNVAENLLRIHAAADGHPYWIDMEGRLRDKNDLFDLAVCQQVLQITRGFLDKTRIT